MCEIPISEIKTWVNHNQHITDKLEVHVYTLAVSFPVHCTASSSAGAVESV